jgi:hypothetical protein
MSNPSADYKEYTKTADPDITYDTTVDRYFVFGKRFITFKQAQWYKRYLTALGFISAVRVLFVPSGSDSLITADSLTFKVRE